MTKFFENAAHDIERLVDFIEKAVYKPRGGTEREVTIIRLQRGITLDHGSPYGSEGKHNVGLMWVARSVIDMPAPGDIFVVDGVTWRVARMDISDPHRHVIEVTSGGSYNG